MSLFMTFAGVDSKPITIKYASKEFKSNIGCIIIIDDYVQFKAHYDLALQEATRIAGLANKRKVLSSYELLELSNGNYDALYAFFEKIKPCIKKLNIFYSSFNTRRIPKILTFGRSKLRKMELFEFLKTHLDNSFPHICIWRIFHSLKSIQAQIFCDSFTTNPTNAWEEISDYEHLYIVPNGDSTNMLISTADIILKILEQKLADNKKSLFLNQIKTILNFENDDKNNFFVHKINNYYYPKITPLKRAKFKLGCYLKHPVYFIIKSKNTAIQMEFIKFNAPKFVNLVTDADGTLLFFDQRQHVDSIKNGDYLIYLDESAKITAENIVKIIPKKIILLDFTEIKG